MTVKRWPGFFEQELGSVRRGADVVLASDHEAEVARLRQQLGMPLETERENERLRELLGRWAARSDLPDIHPLAKDTYAALKESASE